VTDRQQTISKEVSLTGPGLFSGEPATLTFAPAEPDSGITFIREQEGKIARIPALISNVLKRPRRICLKNGTLWVETVEHVMAALAGMGVSNANVRVSGGLAGELPSGDGSSKPFVDLLTDAGFDDQAEALDPLVIKKPLQVNSDHATIAALPGPTDRLEIIYDFEAGAPAGLQDAAWLHYQRHYLAINGSFSTVYQGAFEGLEALRAAGLRLACLTNKPLAFARPLLVCKHLDGYFDELFGGDSFERKKPDPLPLLQTCAALRSTPARTLVVGDSINDAVAARAAGCPVVLVSYGYNHGQPVAEAGADAVIDRLDQLPGLMLYV